MTVALTPDELLTTTRSVRKRLDLTRPVPLDLVLECLELALQAPSGSNRQGWHWLVVTDLQTRARTGAALHGEVPGGFGFRCQSRPFRSGGFRRAAAGEG